MRTSWQGHLRFVSYYPLCVRRRHLQRSQAAKIGKIFAHISSTVFAWLLETGKNQRTEIDPIMEAMTNMGSMDMGSADYANSMGVDYSNHYGDMSVDMSMNYTIPHYPTLNYCLCVADLFQNATGEFFKMLEEYDQQFAPEMLMQQEVSLQMVLAAHPHLEKIPELLNKIISEVDTLLASGMIPDMPSVEMLNQMIDMGFAGDYTRLLIDALKESGTYQVYDESMMGTAEMDLMSQMQMNLQEFFMAQNGAEAVPYMTNALHNLRDMMRLGVEKFGELKPADVRDMLRNDIAPIVASLDDFLSGTYNPRSPEFIDGVMKVVLYTINMYEKAPDMHHYDDSPDAPHYDSYPEGGEEMDHHYDDYYNPGQQEESDPMLDMFGIDSAYMQMTLENLGQSFYDAYMRFEAENGSFMDLYSSVEFDSRIQDFVMNINYENFDMYALEQMMEHNDFKMRTMYQFLPYINHFGQDYKP